MPPSPTSGLHHVTAISGNGGQNLAFYGNVLGLKLVKKTVNFDMPTSYHLYYGDRMGTPGSLLTFFIWQGLSHGRPGRGQALHTRFAVAGGLDDWRARLAARGVPCDTQTRFGETELHFADPDGLPLSLVAEAAEDSPPENIHMDGVVLQVGEADPTRDLLLAMGYSELAAEENRVRFRCAGSARARTLDLELTPEAPWARSGNGVVHHIAFRARDRAHQQQFHDMATDMGLNPSPVMDRNYFRSIYFRCPGGVLFEVATDAPGFAVDEARDHLGESLCLPPSLEFRRAEIEKALPSLG